MNFLKKQQFFRAILRYYPVVVENVYYATWNKKVFILKIDDKSFLELNPSAGILWELCDGSRDVKEIIDVFCKKFKLDKKAAKKDVVDFIAKMNSLKLIKLEKTQK